MLVIGATGRHRNTGAAVADRLIARGRKVRVLTRTNDGRAEALRPKGAATVIGDLHERSTLLGAVDGVSAVYFTYPIALGIIPGAGAHRVTARTSFQMANRQSSIAP
jgi:uncharacterized protein YbjT (DUF2867 family)